MQTKNELKKLDNLSDETNNDSKHIKHKVLGVLEDDIKLPSGKMFHLNMLLIDLEKTD